jgi:hypothetical protein
MAVQAAGAIAIEAPVADHESYSVTWDDIAPALTDRTRAVVLCNPSNPTGAPVDAMHGTRIVSELANRGILVISDETYMHFVYDGAHWSAASVPDWRRNVTVVGTFSKSFAMMGWRVGYMLADAAVCAQATKVQDAMIICAPTISQLAAEAAVREDWDYAKTFHPDLLERRRRLSEGLSRCDGVSWVPTRGGFFAFARVDRCMDSNSLAMQLLEQAHVVSIPGSSFGRSGEGCLRLSYGSVQGFIGDGKKVAPFTQMAGAYDRHTGEDPFELPKSWLDSKSKLKLTTPMNFVTTNDIIGGNSGSPLINAKGNIVGLIFDGNIHSISGSYWFDEKQNRSVAVHPAIIHEALEKVYNALALLKELQELRT